jgi:hypothetical protein
MNCDIINIHFMAFNRPIYAGIGLAVPAVCVGLHRKYFKNNQRFNDDLGLFAFGTVATAASSIATLSLVDIFMDAVKRSKTRVGIVAWSAAGATLFVPMASLAAFSAEIARSAAYDGVVAAFDKDEE